MEMLVEVELVFEARLVDLMQEANELVAVLTASVKTARAHLARK